MTLASSKCTLRVVHNRYKTITFTTRRRVCTTTRFLCGLLRWRHSVETRRWCTRLPHAPTRPSAASPTVSVGALLSHAQCSILHFIAASCAAAAGKSLQGHTRCTSWRCHALGTLGLGGILRQLGRSSRQVHSALIGKSNQVEQAVSESSESASFFFGSQSGRPAVQPASPFHWKHSGKLSNLTQRAPTRCCAVCETGPNLAGLQTLRRRCLMATRSVQPSVHSASVPASLVSLLRRFWLLCSVSAAVPHPAPVRGWTAASGSTLLH